MDQLLRTAAETRGIIAEMRSDLPDSALLGTPDWARLNRLEDTLMRLLAQAESMRYRPCGFFLFHTKPAQCGRAGMALG